MTSEFHKEMYSNENMFNCKEIPEAICVEIRFITAAAAKQKKNEQLIYIKKNGELEFSRNEDPLTSLKNFRNKTKKPPVTVDIQTKPSVSQLLTAQQTPMAPQTLAPLISAQTVAPIVPLATNLNNNNKEVQSGGNTKVVSILPTVATMQIPAVTMPMSTTSLQTLNRTNTVEPAKSLVCADILNVNNKRLLCDQVQQTEVSVFNMKSVAIQCDLDEDLDDFSDWPEIIADPLEISPSLKTKKEEFLLFAKQNTVEYKGSYKECLICGEVCNSINQMYSHIGVHYGTKVLCFKCGHYVDNHAVHNHNCGKTKKAEKALLHCPHYSCGVVAISRLELYDHINEHLNNRLYKCTACQKAFFTNQEFLRHLLIRAKCYTSAKRKCFRLYGLESHSDRLCRVRVFTLHTYKKRTTFVKTFLSQRVPKHGVCKICLRSFGNKFVFNRHRNACVAKFRKRLVRKKLGRTNRLFTLSYILGE